MKCLFVIFAAFVSSASSATAKTPEKFTCGGMGTGTSFGVQFGGPRFADSAFLRYMAEELKPLMLQTETNLKTTEEYFSLSFTVGTCAKIENSDVLVACSNAKAHAWTMASFAFTRADELAPNFVQHSRITRPIEVQTFDLKVRKVGTDAVLELDMTVDTADKKNLQVSFSKKLATLNQDWYMCKFE